MPTRVVWKGRVAYRVGGTLRAPSLIFTERAALKPGDILSVHVKGITHEGIYDGAGSVVHKSQKRGKVVVEGLGEYTRQHPSYVTGNVGAAGVEKAKGRLGEKWTPVRNCQRFVAECSGKPRRSADATKFGVVMVGAALAAFRLAGR